MNPDRRSWDAAPVAVATPTLAEYAATWRAQLKATSKRATADAAKTVLDGHILPALGAIPIVGLERSAIRAFLASKLE
jgi:hypothetical protein